MVIEVDRNGSGEVRRGLCTTSKKGHVQHCALCFGCGGSLFCALAVLIPVLWRVTSTCNVVVCSPCVAPAYAAAGCVFWRDVQAAGKKRKNKPRADRNSNDDAQLRLRLVTSVSRKFRLLPRGELGLYIDLAASSKPYMRIAHCGFTKRMLIAVLEALYKVEKAPRLKEFLDKLREGQRKADAAGAGVGWHW